MCQCQIIIDNKLTQPISMDSKTVSWDYIDEIGRKHVLVDKFEMKILAGSVSISEELDENGEIIAYTFRVSK